MPYPSDHADDEKTRQAVEAAIVTLAACTYAVAFPMLFHGLGPATGAFAIIPVMVASWFWGVRIGVASAVMAGLILNPILLFRAGVDGAGVFSTAMYSAPYFLAILIVAAATGRIRDFGVRLSEIEAATQHRQLELERHAREKMEELLKLKSAFLNNMSHELRTPLTGILGFAEILSDEIDEEHVPFAERIVSNGVRLQETLNSILDLAQLEGGSLELEPERLNIAAHVHAAASFYTATAEQKGLVFRIRTPHEMVESELDRASLQRIVTSLVDNAVKFTTEGFVAVHVSADPDRAYIQVRDSGIGISDTFHPHMFSEFRQESIGHARSYEGSGLGLSITKRLVELMGGSITVESRRGEGSTFTVSFPRIGRPVLDLSTSTMSAVAPMELENSTISNRVLVMDDNPDTLALTTHQLRDAFDLETVSDAEAALASARATQFDAMVLDINMGGGHNGIDVLHALRDMEAYRNVPVLALTAYAMPEDRDRFLQEGFDAYLSKPFTKQQITEALELLLERRSIAL